MSFIRENDLLRPELLLNAAETLSVWPKRDGRNVQVTSASFEVLDPDGVTVRQASGAATLSTVTQGTRTVSRIDCSVAAIALADEDYQLKVSWADATVTGSELVTFDVCVAPLGSLLSLSDLAELQPDLPDALERLGVRLGYPDGQDAKEYAAGIYLTQARQRLQSRLQARAAADDSIRPYMIIDRRAVAAVERMFAMVAIYEALGGVTDDITDDAASLQLRHWAGRAESDWAALRFKYMAPDATDTSPTGDANFGRAFRVVRA